jgi:uncharacterized membrane protein
MSGNRWLRLLQHRWLDERDVRHHLDDAALKRLCERVQWSEARHTGEIRIAIEAGLPLSYVWRDATARDRAVAMFGKLQVWDTEHNNGVLIYLLLAEHAIEIVADRALGRIVPQDEWQRLCAGMSQAFSAGRFEQGLMQAIDAVDALLVRHYPAAAGVTRANELPDRPYVG